MWHSRAQVRLRSWGARSLITSRCAAPFTTCHIALGVIPLPQTRPSRFTLRKMVHVLMPAARVHSSTARFTHIGIGTVRMCFPLPIRSAMTQCSSLTWGSSTLSPTSSARRSPQPTSRARIARSRLPRGVFEEDLNSSTRRRHVKTLIATLTPYLDRKRLRRRADKAASISQNAVSGELDVRGYLSGLPTPRPIG